MPAPNPAGSKRTGRGMSERGMPGNLPHVLVLGVLLGLRVLFECMCSARWRALVVDAVLPLRERDRRDPNPTRPAIQKIGRPTPARGPIPPKLDRAPRKFPRGWHISGTASEQAGGGGGLTTARPGSSHQRNEAAV